MKNCILTLLILFTSAVLSAQDTSAVLIVESHGKITTIRPGQKIKVQSAGIRRPDKGILGAVTDSTIRIDSTETGSRTIRLDAITEVTWYDKSRREGLGPAMIVCGGVMTVGGVVVFRAMTGDRVGNGVEYAVNALVASIIAVPLIAGGVVLMAIGVANADNERAHSRKIGEKGQVRAGGQKQERKTSPVPGSGTAD